MPKAKQITGYLEDRPGTLGQVASALGEKKVNIVAFTTGVTEGRAVIRMVVDKPAAARKVFASLGWQTAEEDVVQVTLADKPGSLGDAAGKLGQAGINIHYAYSGSAQSAKKVNTFFAVSDVSAALKAVR